MDLTKFNFPKPSNTDVIFPVYGAIPELLEEAKARDFYNGNTPYNKLFSNLFFGGGTVRFKKDVDQTFSNDAWRYCRVFMRSFAPKHEEKEAICALIMSEILEPELEAKP